MVIIAKDFYCGIIHFISYVRKIFKKLLYREGVVRSVSFMEILRTYKMHDP